MTGERPTTKPNGRSFMASLARDVRGNTLAMMAMFLIPLTGLVGSAVDMSRLYVVKARLQQACDAGALAGRKAMTSTTSTLDSGAVTQATSFFSNNFKMNGTPAGTLGFMNTSAVTFVPTKTSDSQVAATASAAVPMTITQMFGTPSVTVSVTCQARFDVADTDVMFVLDTTGSMACLPGGADSCGTGTYTYTRPSSSGGVPGYAGTVGAATTELTSGGSNVSRIEALRKAVLSFYDTFAAAADPTTHVRYGFVTYSSVVNAGQAIMDISPAFMVGGTGSETANYQARHVVADYVSNTATNSTSNGKSQTNCTASIRTPTAVMTYSPTSYTIPAATGASQSTGTAGTASRVYDYWSSSSGKCQTRTDTIIPSWEYKQLAFNVNPLVAGNTITDPTKVAGQTTRWIGCVETTVDSPGATTFNTASLPSELNPDLFPSGTTRWWPHLQDLAYARNNLYNGTPSAATDTSNGDDTTNDKNYGADPAVSDTALRDGGFTTCGKPVKRLSVMSRQDVYNYVYATDFVPEGGTYHDTGMIWGTRLISPSGPWAADTAAWPNDNAPNRVIVFLTDGAMAPDNRVYGMYGIEAFDKRVANGNTSTTLATFHNNRFLAECAAAKARNINIWTVSIATSANAQLTACATTSGQALATTDGTGLSTAFASIAQRLAMLRITK